MMYPKIYPYEFYLEFINPETGKIVQTTSEFVDKNQTYLIRKITNTATKQKIIDPKTGQLNKIDKNYVAPKNNQLSTSLPRKPHLTGCLSNNICLNLLVIVT